MINNLYTRAEKFFPWNLQNDIFNCTIFPYWTDNAFYYFQRTPEDLNLVRVDSETGKKQLIFNGKSLLKALSIELNNEICFLDLPFDKFLIINNPLTLKFTYHKKNYFYNIENGSLKSDHETTDQLPSPDGKNILKIKNHNLFLHDVSNKINTQITFDGTSYYDYATSPETNTRAISNRLNKIDMPPIALWSPDGQKIVTHKLDQRNVSSLHLLQNAPENQQRPIIHEYKMSFSGDSDIPIAELIVIDINTKKITPLHFKPLLSPYLTPIEFKWVWWNEKSDKIYFLHEARSSKELTLCVADSSTGFTNALINEVADKTYVEPSQFFLWPKQLLILENLNKIIWLSERSGYSHLYLFEIGNNSPKAAITQGNWCVRELHFYDSTNDWVYFTGTGYNPNEDPYYKYLFRCRLDGSELTILTKENADHTIQFSQEKNSFLDTYSKIDSAPVTLLRNMKGEKIAIVEEADISGLSKYNWVPPVRFKAKARDGITDIFGNLYFPSNFDENKSYPIIDHIYPGPQLYRTPTHFTLYGLIFRSPWTAQALAELGFIVIHIDGLGTPGRSKEFHDATYQNMSDCGIADHVSAIRELSLKYPFINLDKVGITGFSGGGYAAVRAMLLYPDFYKVGVAAAGNHDLRCYPASYGEKYNSLDVKTYEYQSNAALAKNLSGKLLLIHGEMDDNVHPCATMQLVKSLIAYNKNFDMLIMPNLNHPDTFDHPYYIRRQWDYLIENLLDVSPPHNEEHILSKIPDHFPQLIDW